MDGIEKVLLYFLIPVTLAVWVFIGILIIRQKIRINPDHSCRLRRGLRRTIRGLDLGNY